jgi:hypothetical protein
MQTMITSKPLIEASFADALATIEVADGGPAPALDVLLAHHR